MPKILIIDDSRFARMQVVQCLKDAGYDVIEAANGVEGLEIVKGQSPDLILCDLLMPEMDGITFLESLKEREIGVPVFVVTSDIQEKTKEKVISLGVNGMLNKPAKCSDILASVKSILGG